MKRNRIRTALLAATLALALAAPPAGAATGDEAAPDDWMRAANYVGCALGIIGATTGWGCAAVVINCLRLLKTDP